MAVFSRYEAVGKMENKINIVNKVYTRVIDLISYCMNNKKRQVFVGKDNNSICFIYEKYIFMRPALLFLFS